MNLRSNGDYYRARLRAEREATELATCAEARAAHQTLANHYAQLLSAMPDQPRSPALAVVRDLPADR
ncbi:MAG: hypothetical protein ACJ8F4_00125 [Sphingomonas sp.]